MQYLRMPYGIKPASGIFQRLIENRLKNIPKTVVRIDDILVTGETDEEHLENLSMVLNVLKEMGVTVNDKCSFFVDEVEYMGHIISKNGIRTNDKKVADILQIPAPKNVKDIESFIGGINYYSKYIPDMATIANPLYRLLTKDQQWEWTDLHNQAFNSLKMKLTTAPVLINYNPKLPLKLPCDASGFGLGAVLSHVLPDNSERPIAYASRTLNEHEKNYSQLDKDPLSLGLKNIINIYLVENLY